MKRIQLFTAVFSAALLTGCATTSTVTEFDRDGNVTKVTVTERDPFDKVTESTRDKSVVAWSNGWAAYISVSTATTEDPTPTGKIFAGKVSKGVITLHKDQRNADAIPAIIAATREDIRIGSDGIAATGSADTTTESPGK